MAYRLGVDLGTTWTAAAVADDGEPTMLGLGNRALQIPSVIYLQPDGHVLVGEAAERRGLEDPTRLAREFKRRLGDPVPILVGGTPFSPQALLVHLLRSVVDKAQERLGEAPTSLVLTHPANWGPFKQDLLRQVITMADLGDLKEVGTCTEPQAAAMQYAARNPVDPSAPILVYDLGGGTFDVCVLAQREGQYETLGKPEGIEHLGGIDFDEALFRHVMAQLPDVDRIDPTDPDTRAAVARLRRDCVDAKEALSSDHETVLRVTLPQISSTVLLKREDFEQLIGPSLDDTFRAVQRAMRSAQIEDGDLSAVVLVGGSSRIPMIASALSQRFGTHVAVDTHPKHDVALGATRLHLPVSPGASVPAGLPVPAGPAPAAVASPVAERVPEPVAEPVPERVAETVAEPVPEPRPAAARDADPPGGQLRRRAVLVAGAAAALVLGTAGILWATSQGDDASSSISHQAPASTGTGSTGTGSAGTGSAAVPAAAVPLPDDAMVVTRTANGNSDLWAVDESGKALRRITRSPDDDLRPVLSQDRRSVIFRRDQPVTPGSATVVPVLWVAGVDGTGARPLFSAGPAVGLVVGRPAWSPDQQSIAAIASPEGEPATLYRISIDGTTVTPLTTGSKLGDPAWSPDGASIAYWQSPPTDLDGGTLMSVPADAKGKPRQILPGAPGQDADPAWSPDGRLIAFRRRLTSSTDIFVMAADGTGLRRLTQGARTNQDPSWSADGRQFAFKSNRSGQDETYVMTASGADEHPLDRGVRTTDPPAWTRR